MKGFPKSSEPLRVDHMFQSTCGVAESFVLDSEFTLDENTKGGAMFRADNIYYNDNAYLPESGNAPNLKLIDISGIDFKSSYAFNEDFDRFGNKDTLVYVKNEESRNFLLSQKTPWSSENIIVGKPSN